MMRERDSKRQAVYNAETEVRQGLRMGRLDDVRAYVERVVRSRWFRNRYGDVGDLKYGNGRRRAIAHGTLLGGRNGRITLPLWARNELTVLHELAHLITPSRVSQGLGKPTRLLAHHGPEWIQNHLALVRRWMGNDVYKTLKAAFRKRGVRLAPKRTMKLTVAERQRRRLHMLAVRQRRKEKQHATKQ